ncbi:hypothetical protein EMIT0P43_20471 [Pseudomonas jessenii]
MISTKPVVTADPLWERACSRMVYSFKPVRQPAPLSLPTADLSCSPSISPLDKPLNRFCPQ